MWNSHTKRISFADARNVLTIVLRDVGDKWADRIAVVSPASFSSLLGGMGSFSDLIICKENGHEIIRDRIPLANEMLSCLTGICFAASKSRELSLSANDAIRSCGLGDLNLTGCRCLNCGHAQVGSIGIRSIIAVVQVRKAISKGIANGTPIETLISLWRTEEDSDSVRQVIDRVQSSGILYDESDSWMRPCSNCGSEDTCVYRWKEANGRFVPTEDILPLRLGQRSNQRPNSAT